jgi:hypothetical protein
LIFKSTEFWTDELNPLAKLRLFKVLIALILTFCDTFLEEIVKLLALLNLNLSGEFVSTFILIVLKEKSFFAIVYSKNIA